MRLLLFTFLLSALSFGQDRNGISYQALIINPNVEQLPGQDNDHSPLTNTDICLQFHVINSSGNYEYSESQSVTTDAYGMVNLVIGTGLPIGAITWDAVAWSAEAKSLKVDLDITGACTSFTELSNQQLTSVPFALYSPSSNVPGPKGDPGDPGEDGDSAYQVWLDEGNTGTEQEFLDSLKGTDGTPGDPGADGDSAYQVWLDAGNTGTEQEFLDSLKGADGDPGQGTEGKSAYDIWIELGNTGSEQDFIDSLVGPQGEPGDLSSGNISIGGNPNNNEILSFGLTRYLDNGGYASGYVRLSHNGNRLVLNESVVTGKVSDNYNQRVYEFSDQNGLVQIGNTIEGNGNYTSIGMLNGNGSKLFRVIDSKVEIYDFLVNTWEITQTISIQTSGGNPRLNAVSADGNMFIIDIPGPGGTTHFYKKSINGEWSKSLDIPFNTTQGSFNESSNTFNIVNSEEGNFNDLGTNGKIQVYSNYGGALEQKGSDIFGINNNEDIGRYGKYIDNIGENLVFSYTIRPQWNTRVAGFRVYKFITADNNWVQKGQDVLPTFFSNTSSLKYEISNNGDRLAVALLNDKHSDSYGSLSVRVYTFNGTDWELGNSGINFFTSQNMEFDSIDIKNGIVALIVGDEANKYLKIKKIY